MTDEIKRLKELVDSSDNIVFFGGAGVSTESGIPDFRSTDGLYHQEWKYPPEVILSHTFYESNPEEFFRFYRAKMLAPDARPNAAHKKLAEWEAEGIRRGGPDLDAKVTIKEFRFPRFTRRVNHLVGLLDRWSLSQLIERDDAAVSKLLGKLTLPKEETEQYLEQAIACGAKNCTAALLEYKNAHRGAVDPMDAFVLD